MTLRCETLDFETLDMRCTGISKKLQSQYKSRLDFQTAVLKKDL